ncbi:MAG: NADH-quinone oxidoreductase subunit C [Acidimicrobiales bacterium]
MSDQADSTASADPAAADGPAESDQPTRYGVPATSSRGQQVLHPRVDQWLDVASAARDDGFDQLVDLTAVDFLTFGGDRRLPAGIEPERFEVVAGLLGHHRGERLRLRTQVTAADPTIVTLFDLWPAAEALEREVLDLFGIVFTDHPDPTRILMPEDWQGHPLRKDYAVGAIPVQFKAATNLR